MDTKIYASVSWCTDDVIQNARDAGIKIGKQNAEELLRHYEARIGDAMVEAGWRVIELALAKTN